MIYVNYKLLIIKDGQSLRNGKGGQSLTRASALTHGAPVPRRWYWTRTQKLRSGCAVFWPRLARSVVKPSGVYTSRPMGNNGAVDSAKRRPGAPSRLNLC